MRERTKTNAKWTDNVLIKNGKYFVAPQQTDEGFKRLFARLAAAGAGRPVDRDGFPDGPWTPEKLADAISSIESNPKGIELRSVQVWFQDNDNGISDANIRWLARIFGCDDLEATGQWQTELKAAKERLAGRRRDKRNALNDKTVPVVVSDQAESAASDEIAGEPTVDLPQNASISVAKRRTLAEKCERMLSGAGSLNLQIGYLLVFCGLGVMNYALGTLSVTYRPVEGLDKQVGFIWAPTLTVLPLIALPAYIFFVSRLITYWRRAGRAKCVSDRAMSINPTSHAAWYARVKDFSFSFWAIALFCFLFVFGFQWAGIYLPAYLSGDTNGVQIDRYLVTLVRPEIISIREAIVLSGIGYMYTASYISVFMFGLLFATIITLDFEDICRTSELEGSITDPQGLCEEGQKVIWGVFRVTVFALWLANLIKLQITYLQSDSPDFITWLFRDAAAAFGVNARSNRWLENTTISHFTTFLMMVVSVVIFIVCVMKMRSIYDRLALYDSEHPFQEDRQSVTSMFLVIGLLSLNLILVGRFTGFSVMLAMSAVASIYVLVGPKLRTF